MNDQKIEQKFELTPDELVSLRATATKIHLSMQRGKLIFIALANNALLLKEVNAYRAEKGLEPYKSYDPQTGRERHG